ncbi:MAG: hypothetical protein JO061_19195 [Acidobacteriaceae bacterium]|nr:hypothetical protein [Acidobacteriaceae bacterium]
MATINEIKQLSIPDTPILFFECELPSGDVELWCTHSIVFNSKQYSARVLKHNLFDLQLSADDAMDGISHLSLTLANADSAMSELNQEIGFKGSQLTVYFAFADLPSGTITTESTILFKGVAGDPDEITEEWLQLTFTNKLSLQRIPVPDVRVQRSCPWSFPATPDQRQEAVNGGEMGRYSRFYRCGYSADQPNGVGNLNNGAPFTTCDGSRTQCIQRGMFSSDSQQRNTSRFGGFEFVPSAVLVRTHGDKTSHISPLLDNTAKYNDPVPIVYGTGWLKAPVIFSRNDGNLTHMEVLAGMGAITSILKVVVNGVEIPQGVAGADMTASGWYQSVTSGTRNGNFNLDFTDSNGNPLGDPYGSICVLSVIVPNSISTGKSLPVVQVLMQGMQLDVYNADGSFQSTTYTNNPAWVILDILQRCGWDTSELNLGSFSSSAAFCGTLISTTDLNGNPIYVPRYECNLILTKRQSAASVVRGIRVGSCLMLRYGTTGLLELLPENTIAGQQPALPDGSNSTDPLNNGWPAYEFSDASAPFSGIARTAQGASSLRVLARSVAETSNRLSVEFQDEWNEYQQDSLSVVNADDAALIGYEVSSQSTALGIANMSQANRVLLRQLDKSIDGNLFVEFQTSFRALKIRPGDIIALTYLKEGFSRTPFRVVKLSPSLNYQLVTVVAQIHDDDWYSDNPAVLAAAGRQPGAQSDVPRPLIGLVPHNDSNGNLEYFDFQITDFLQSQGDGTATDILTVGFSVPSSPDPNAPSVPLVSLAPQFSATGGSLAGGVTQYYAVTAVDQAGREGPLSFTVPAAIPNGSNTNTVTLVGLSFPATATSFNVYRGTTPQLLYRIASEVALSSTYTDTGSSVQPVGPPDSSFDHANFYYRYEFAGPFEATSASSSTIACADMGAVPLAYAGMLVRIIDGSGRGQERTITTNDATTLTVTPAWSFAPDTTSTFVICESSWHFAAVSSTSPVQFELPYRAGTVVQVSGRGASVTNAEGFTELCPVSRFALGSGAESGTPGAPAFTLTAPGAGEIVLSQVGFTSSQNTSSVSSGTLQLFYWNELSTTGTYSLSAAMDGSTQVLTMNAAGLLPGHVVQVDTELMVVLSSAAPNTYQVLRGAVASQAAAHNANDPVLILNAATVVVPFALNFFSNRASMNFLHTMSLPDVRIAGAQFFVTNAFGDSQATSQCYLTAPDAGLRTLSGGQFALQVAGVLATQQNATPPLIVEASHAVRDMRASVGQAATGYSIAISLVQNGTPFCSLVIPSGATVSSVVDGTPLGPLTDGASLSLNVVLNIDPTYTGSPVPGRDLTVTIRL